MHISTHSCTFSPKFRTGCIGLSTMTRTIRYAENIKRLIFPSRYNLDELDSHLGYV